MPDLQSQVNDLSTQLARVTSDFQQLSQAHDALVQQLDQLRAQLEASIGTRAVETTSLHVTNGANLDGNLTVGGTISGTLANGIVGESQLANSSVDGRVLASLSVAGGHLSNNSVDGRIIAPGVVSESHMDAVLRAKIDGALPSSGGSVGPVQFTSGFSFSKPNVPAGAVVTKAALVSVGNNPLHSLSPPFNASPCLCIEGPSVVSNGGSDREFDYAYVVIPEIVTGSLGGGNVECYMLSVKAPNGFRAYGSGVFGGDLYVGGTLTTLRKNFQTPTPHRG